ncbi:MAG TPA: A/G-specific adenine glycosylase [Flavobacterium sp.]|uniref:A/G-specific adenine glycosylase n=1 Tax=Flavobacterium sp. TaxID=239 RepID=UPI002CD64ECD|nr:A/G-specific adenine glycosylase [Flavobacterium sp.]HSD15086.1 A/G-specific adenine glycosylase [Flavobacterium sp.]
MDFTNLLIQWYLREKRDLPWRKTPHPYPVWLSEIMLQQTRVAQGLPYFLRFTEAFPTVFDLANADEEQVLKLWQGLGYYSRARNLHATAKHIAFDLNGNFPNNYIDLLKLKGVGEYTAAAIASIAYGEPVPVVDGNVYRVLSRYFDVDTDITSASAKKEFFELAASLLPVDRASDFNQAMMEFGALQCVPKSPDCQNCVLSGSCLAFKHNKVGMLPVKLKKTKVSNRYFNYLIIKDANGNSVIRKRAGKGIWHNLYEFPMLETAQEDDFETVFQLVEKFSSDLKPTDIKPLHHNLIVHKLSHQHLRIQFWKVKTSQKIENALPIEEIKKFPFPIVIHNFMEEHWANV